MALLAIWELLAHAGAADPRFLPRLEEVAARGMAEFSRGGLGSNLLVSLERDLIGFVYGSVAESRLVRRSIFPPHRTPERLVVAVVLPLLRDLIMLTMPPPFIGHFLDHVRHIRLPRPVDTSRLCNQAAVIWRFHDGTGGSRLLSGYRWTFQQPTTPMVARTGRPSTA
ncbi:hypothetical protein NKH99_24940 [Mesorhizobium sp. M0854]|uniref:hypothetical protein n=1 Tax=Mesorhizobium sp. M0854 TaxID=2957013 RepID=UPI003336E1E3